MGFCASGERRWAAQLPGRDRNRQSGARPQSPPTAQKPKPPVHLLLQEALEGTQSESSEGLTPANILGVCLNLRLFMGTCHTCNDHPPCVTGIGVSASSCSPKLTLQASPTGSNLAAPWSWGGRNQEQKQGDQPGVVGCAEHQQSPKYTWTGHQHLRTGLDTWLRWKPGAMTTGIQGDPTNPP